MDEIDEDSHELKDYGGFEWDPQKAKTNVRKHKIRFEDAIAIFSDGLRKRFDDMIVDGELRHQVIGMAGRNLLLIVTYTIRRYAKMKTIRIINARKPTNSERMLYEEGD